MHPPTIATLFDRGTVAAADDTDLLSRFVSDRDEAAFTALVTRHGPMVWATARAILGNDHDAADTFQATFLVLARRAASLRRGSALAAWLHRVAERSAVAVRRAARQRHRIEQAAALVREDGPTTDRATNVRAEIACLPHSYRLAVILCDLEGLTYAEAAARLGCTEPALRNRLARARSRLRERLEPGIVLPPALIPATVAVGLGRIGGRAGWGWVMGKVALAVVGGIVAVGVVVLTRREVAQTPVAAVPVRIGQAAPLVIQGRVLSPQNEPVGGAIIRLFAAMQAREGTRPTTLSEPDGRFVMPISAQVVAEIPALQPGGLARSRDTPKSQPDLVLVATAPGFGVGWVEVSAERAELEVHLIDPGPPVEGRVLDGTGQPVIGARVATLLLVEPKRISTTETAAAALTRLLAQPKVELTDKDTNTFPISLATTTDAAGRFALGGVGAERLVMCQITGPTIASRIITAVTRPDGMVPIVPPVAGRDAEQIRAQYANGIDWTVEPTRIIAGSVRDARSNLPMSGWKVTGSLSTGLFDLFGPSAESTTDTVGQYRLVGLPRFVKYNVSLEAPEGQPYLDTWLDGEAEPGMAPVTFDISIARAALARGRITDTATGQPVLGRVSYVHLGQPAVAGLKQVATDAAGRYEIAVPIGRSLLWFDAADRDHYRIGQWSRRITPPRDPAEADPGSLAAYGGTHHALAEIQVEPAAPAEVVNLGVVHQDGPPQVERVDIQLDPKRRVELTLLGPDGQPVRDAEVRGVGDMVGGLLVRQDGSAIILDDFGPTDARRITARDRRLRLAGAVTVTLEHGPKQVLPLGPWGEVTGRVVAADGTPIHRARLTSGPRFGPGPAVEPVDVLPGTNDDGGIVTDADGRFHVVGLVPGTHYGASVADPAKTILGDLFADLTVGAGQIKDLGTIVLRPARRD